MGIESADVRRVLHEIRVLGVFIPIRGLERVYKRPLTPITGR